MNAPENPWVELCPGIKRQTIAHGPKMYQQRAELDAGSRMPEHHHAQEQVVYVVSGRVCMITNGERHEMSAGDSLYLAGDVPHSAETHEDTVIIDTFSPPREDYLAKDDEVRRSQ